MSKKSICKKSQLINLHKSIPKATGKELTPLISILIPRIEFQDSISNGKCKLRTDGQGKLHQIFMKSGPAINGESIYFTLELR